jgi:hypothetical protein
MRGVKAKMIRRKCFEAGIVIDEGIYYQAPRGQVISCRGRRFYRSFKRGITLKKRMERGYARNERYQAVK